MQLADGFNAMLDALECLQHLAHRFAGHAHHTGNYNSRQRIFEVMRTRDIHFVAAADRLLALTEFENNVAFGHIRAVRHLLLAGEPCHLRL